MRRKLVMTKAAALAAMHSGRHLDEIILLSDADELDPDGDRLVGSLVCMDIGGGKLAAVTLQTKVDRATGLCAPMHVAVKGAS